MLIKSNTKPEPVPAGKRRVRETVWGNVNAYVGRRFWKTLGPTYSVGIDEAIADWLSGKDDK